MLALVCAAPGCSNLIGLNGYSVAGLGGESEARTRPDAGSGGSMSAGGAGSAGSADAASAAGAAGETESCVSSCDDNNECTDDACVSEQCVHGPVTGGAPCGGSQICDGRGACVRCIDTADGSEQDSGCTATAPICVGNGTDASCAGCTKNADCDDGNECTTETCADTRCVITAVAAGEACSKGVCNGAAPEKCVTCANTANAGHRDAGCTAALPICDPVGNGNCYACTEDADCANDDVSCTVEKCTNHVCAHVPTDSKCPAAVDACSRSKCDATAGCTTVAITPTAQSLIAADPGKGNGSFEAGSKPATGWEEDGPYFITKNCSSGCIPGSNGGVTYPSTGKVLAWFGGIADANFGDLNRIISLPVGAVSLHVQADTNFQTASSSSNAGYLEVRLMDAGYVQIGSALYSKSAQAVQVGDTHVWTANGIDVTTDVKALAGKDVSVSFHSFTDPQHLSDFFVDNVRVSVTFCQ